MKLVPLSLCFLLFAFLLAKLPTSLSSEVEPVLDINGNLMFQGATYYIRPAIRGAPGGGVRLGKTGNSECPVTALQDYKEVENGLPVRLSYTRQAGTGIIFTATRLNIVFTKKPNCVESSQWLVFIDKEIGKRCVGIGSEKDHPGKQTQTGTFYIQKHGLGYKLVFCVWDSQICLDIGSYDNHEGGRRLNLIDDEHDEPFELVFVPADVAHTGIRSVV